ncbi:MAG: hypothetical protein IJV98_06265 [Clostridia bacterium]|nr:hypothetical protein [Clostridia bacterium]
MNGDLGEKLDQILANPAMLAQIKTLADTMTASGGASVGESAEDKKQDPPPALPSLPTPSPAMERNLKNTRNLLIALKPFLDEKRCTKVDKMLSMMRLAEMAGQFSSFIG